MKKIYIFTLLLSSLLSPLSSLVPRLSAQSYYKCDGFNFTKVNITEDALLPLDWSDIDSITFNEPRYPEVTIHYDGTTAEVTIPANVTGVTCTSGNSSHVVLTSTNETTEYLYTITGESTDGSLTVNGTYKLTLKLAGVNLTSTKGAAIDIECGKRIDIILAEGTTNTFADSSNGTQKAAFYVKGHVELKGNGTLNVFGNTKHAISVKEYLVIKASAGNINIQKAVNDGIHCGKGVLGDSENNYFQMNGGTISISGCGSDCIDTDDYGCAYINGGTLTMNVTQQDGTGLKVDSILSLRDGSITANVTGNISDGIRCSYRADLSGGTINATVTGNGSRGMRGKKASTGTVLNGGNMNFLGTNVIMNVTGSTYTADQSKCFGIKADQTLTQSAGDISITAASTATAIKATTDKWIGGTRNGSSK